MRKRNFKNKSRPCKANSQRIIYLHFLLYIMFGFVFLFLAYCKYLLICQSFLCGASRIHAHCNCFGALSLDHLVRLRQWEHSKKSRTTRKYNSQAFVFAWANLFVFIVCLHVFFCALILFVCRTKIHAHCNCCVALSLAHIVLILISDSMSDPL